MFIITMLRLYISDTRVARFGGNANNGTNAGGFYWNLNNASSNRNRNIGRRHAVLHYLFMKYMTCPLGRTHNDPHKSLVGKPKNLERTARI